MNLLCQFDYFSHPYQLTIPLTTTLFPFKNYKKQQNTEVVTRAAKDIAQLNMRQGPLNSGRYQRPLCKRKPLERLATNEVAPSTDFRWYSLGLGELLAHALSEEDGGL